MSFELPTSNFSKADLEASNKKPVYVATAVGFALATGSVILRGIARRKSKTPFAWDDYTILFALILLYGLDVITLLSAAKYGLGQHLPAVLRTISPFQKAAIANIGLWLATAAVTKASLLLLYYRIFRVSPRFRRAIYMVTAVIFCQWFSLTFAGIFQCRPVAAFWDHSIQGAKCIDLPRFGIISGVLNLMTDVLILCLPIPMVWALQMTNAGKITVTGMFLLGAFVCAISIIRMSKISGANYNDPTWRLVDTYVWTTLEIGVGITSACLPTLGPLFKNIFSNTPNTNNANQTRSWPHSERGATAEFNRLVDKPSPPSYEFVDHCGVRELENV